MGNVGIFRYGEHLLEKILQEVRNHPEKDRVGAVVIFTGVVRGVSEEGRVRELSYEVYREMVLNVLNEIRREIVEKYGIIDLWIHHIEGRAKVGVETFFVVAISEHRREAFEAVREAVNRVKKEAPIWKKEILEDGREYWVQE
ncbi:MAG TPA: molybdenum cofactor biosynthesis protein MoaE [Candidatus Bathyarchaeota archaeon]|nr:molybdenum cofactor biosynthesis protein MoaE [Candidatus Bathyarchaeota archaeon]